MDKKLNYKPFPFQPARLLRLLFDQPYLLLLFPPLFWSGNFIIGRAVWAEVPPVGLAFWRWCGGSILLLLFTWPYLQRDWPRLRGHWGIIILLSFLGVAAFNTLVYTGLRSTTAINALLLQSMMPVMIVLISFLFLRETVGPLQIAGIILSLAGVTTIIAQGDIHILATLSLNIGDVLIFIAVIGYAVYSIWLRRRPALHPLSFLTITFIIGALLLLPLYLWESWAVQPVSFDRVTLLTIGYVAIFPSILAYLCYNRGVELAGASRAGLFVHLMPVFGSILAMIFLGERFHWFHGLGIGLILAGIVLATRPRNK
ncbi:MAG: DMT family transporter [Anaerolineae bacterium]